MENNGARRPYPAARWWWLAVPLVISCLGWGFAPFQLTSSGWSAMGATLVAAFAGVLATALTGPATIVVLRAIGAMPRLSFWQYAGTLFAVALPALSFETLDVQASAMPAFLGNWAASDSSPFAELWSGLCFVGIYAVMAGATYAFARRSATAAAVAAVIAAVLILGWVVYDMSRFA